MYLNILKKDLKRKKTMNIILLIFIILATMFVSSSVNNILNVTSALDNYLDMAKAPDYFVATMNKIFETDPTTILNSAKSIEDYSVEKILFLEPKNFIFENEDITVLDGTNIIQSDKELSLNYFLTDGSKLKKVEQGKIYMTEAKAEKIGLKKGEKITIEIDGVKNEFVFAGGIKDAVLGTSGGVQRYIISNKDYEKYISNLKTDKMYGGNLIYIHTNNTQNTLSEIKLLTDNSVFNMDRLLIKFSYIFDMIVTGIILAVSFILIAIAFVVLRFTITFTLAEEFREIGVMKAIGISNLKIRGLYLIKYMALSTIGAGIGVILSFPFGKMIMNVSSTSIIISSQNPIFINIFCAVIIVFVILMFCFRCTSKVKKMKPIDAIRNGQTGERFRKKSYMKLGKSRLPKTSFLALNDIVSSPKRYCIITIIFFLCTSLLLVLAATVSTMKSGSLYSAFGIAHSDVVVNDNIATDILMENGHEKLEKFLDDLEEKLEKKGMPANCMKEMMFTLPVSFDGNIAKLPVLQGTGTTMDMYKYLEGTVPKNSNEIAITKISANKIKATIGDTITIKTIDGDKNYIITAYFQSMIDKGDGIKLHTNEKINYIQSYGGINTQIVFTDNPNEEEIEHRVKKIKENFPEFEIVETSANFISDKLGVTEALNAIKILVTIITILLTILITVLMERSFIEKERGEIGLMKAIGIGDGKIYLYHVLRFLFIGMISVIISEIFAIPLTHLCIDPIFKMMGLEIGVDYIINPIETYIIFPAIVFITTMISAYLTSMYIRKIKSSDISNIE